MYFPYPKIWRQLFTSGLLAEQSNNVSDTLFYLKLVSEFLEHTGTQKSLFCTILRSGSPTILACYIH
jgi:hypothetical protein